VMAPGALDAKTKEMLYVAVSVAHGCSYCIHSHTAGARAKGMTVDGPQPPDTFFAKANGGAYDVCVAMYHDQGHIPVKMRGFRFDARSNRWESVNGINVSLGMPILRVSVDHGTAFDQAGKGTASDASLLDAIEYAARMSASVARVSKPS